MQGLDLGADESTVLVTGSVKFDGAQSDRDNPVTRRLAALADIHADDVDGDAEPLRDGHVENVPGGRAKTGLDRQDDAKGQDGAT